MPAPRLRVRSRSLTSALRALAKAQEPAVPLSAVLRAAAVREQRPADQATVRVPQVRVSRDSPPMDLVVALPGSLV